MIETKLADLLKRVITLEDNVTTLGVKKVALKKGATAKTAFDLYYDSVKDAVKAKNAELNAGALRSLIKKQYNLLPGPEKGRWVKMELDAVNACVNKVNVPSLKEVAPDDVNAEVKQQVQDKTAAAAKPAGGLAALATGDAKPATPAPGAGTTIRRRTVKA